MSTAPPEKPAPLSAPAAAQSSGPLSAELLDQVRQADREAAKRFRWPGILGIVNAIIMGICAGISGIIWMISLAWGEWDVWGVILMVALAIAAWCELRGRRLMLALDVRGPRLLGWNQLGLLGIIAAYCIWQIGYAYLAPQDPAVTQAGEQIKSALNIDFAKMLRQITLAFYLAVLLGVGVSQVFCARYYFRRGKMIRDYIAQTPQWILDLRRMQRR